ncbi:PAS domain-containing protein [Erythrobacter sp.]|uniref:PAS domain-containing sensor histidine kinase n=1 Tax=Erythrobacter sp. TaxID=1042 RepID=UPI0025DCCE16|nr:PAS domain-containing protein [Erythrobacter sp.]
MPNDPRAHGHQNPLGENIFRAAFQAFPAAACILEPAGDDSEANRDWRCVAVSDAMQTMFEGDELTGQTLRGRFPAWADEWCASCEQVLADGKEHLSISAGSQESQLFEIALSRLPCEGRDAVIAKVRDVSSEYAALASQRQIDARYRTLFNAIDEGFCIAEVLFSETGEPEDYRFLEANRAFVEHTGLNDPVGKRIREMQPDIEDHWVETYGRIAQTGMAERFESESSAMGRWFDVFAFPIGDTAPFFVGILFEDVRERKEMELALRHSESRLHSLIDATSDLIFRMNPDGTDIQQLDGRGPLGSEKKIANLLTEHIPADDRKALKQALKTAMRNRAPLAMEHRVINPEGIIRWLNSRAVPVLDDRGEITEWFGMATDITGRRKVEEQLAHGAQMLRVASEIGKVGLWDWNVETGDLTWSDEHFRQQGFEVGEVSPTFEIWASGVHPDDIGPTRAKLDEAMKTGEEYVNEYRVTHRDGTIRWLSGRGRFLYDPAGKPVRMLGAMIDATERRRQEEWHKLLVAELQHRVRNLIGMVRSVARLSAPSHRNVDEYVDHLIGRLQAMGRTQSTLTRSPGAKVDLAELVREELLVHAARPDQCLVEGPDVALSPHAAEIVTLAIHELATNSIKYGALGDKGYIRIVWTVSDREAETWVALRWQETSPHGNPKPSRKGFGRRLIEERVPYELRGTGRLDVHDTGVLAQLEFPLVEGPSILETRSHRLGRI